MQEPHRLLNSLATRAAALHSLPAVAMQVLELTARPQVDIRRLKECIENDPALTSKILRVVNSSLFGLSTEVTNLNQALALLGIKPLKLLVLGFSLPQGLFAGLEGELYASYWRLTLTRAVAAREISRAVRGLEGDEPFIAALLMDIGLPAMVEGIGPAFLRFWEKARACGGELRLAERRALGFDHVDLTRKLLEQWRLPAALVDAAALPLEDSVIDALPAESRSRSQAVRLAQQVAIAATVGHPLARITAYELAWRDFQLTRPALDQLFERLEQTVQQLADVLSLRLPPGCDHVHLMSQAHATLVQAAADSAADMLRAQVKRSLEELQSCDELQQLLRELNGLAEAAHVTAQPQRPATPMTPSPHRQISANAAPRTVNPPAALKPAAAAQRVVDVATAADEPLVREALASALAVCRTRRWPLSLLLIHVEGLGDMAIATSAPSARVVWRVVQSVSHQAASGAAHCLQLREELYAVLLPNCDRREAVRTGDELVRALRMALETEYGAAEAPLRVCQGVASVAQPSAHFPLDDLLRGATRCLNAALAANGDCLKSIEMY